MKVTILFLLAVLAIAFVPEASARDRYPGCGHSTYHRDCSKCVRFHEDARRYEPAYGGRRQTQVVILVPVPVRSYCEPSRYYIRPSTWKDRAFTGDYGPSWVVRRYR